jgi:hypothetical protein
MQSQLSERNQLKVHEKQHQNLSLQENQDSDDYVFESPEIEKVNDQVAKHEHRCDDSVLSSDDE